MILQGFEESEFKQELKELICLVRMNEQFSAVRAATNMIELDEFSQFMYEQRRLKIVGLCKKYGIES